MNSDEKAPKFLKNIFIKGKIEVITGLHIGGLKDTVKIGGIDSPVITVEKFVDNGKREELPYIPGSSLKGKMRRLLTNVYGENYDLINKVFGKARESKDEKIEPTRVIFRDAYIDQIEGTSNLLEEVTEIKGENSIDPVTLKPDPRFIQRIKPGTRFSFEIVLTIFEGDDENKILNLIKEGFELMKDSYLGGHGSRGYGRINITLDTNYEKRDISYYEKAVNE